ncbi:MFS transporter [Microbacterium sp. 22303]|uniref:MFS transporter n=1 Tax=Microbacterium sp. 22303 TaxID=3453905 RepID=UPI003F87C88E
MQNVISATEAVTDPRGEIRSGWKPLIGGIALYGGSPIILLQTGGLFIEPVAQETGLPVSVVAIAPIVTLLLALGQPVVGAIIQRTGTRLVAIASLLTMITGLVLLAVLPSAQATFLLVAVLIGVGGSLGFTSTVAKYLSLWFRKNFGFAFGIVGGAASVIPLIAIPLISAAIYDSGWRAGYWVLAGSVAVICLPMVLVLLREPQRESLPADTGPAAESTQTSPQRYATYRGVLADARYWLIVSSVLFVCLSLGGFIVHLQPILLSNGVPVEVATAMTMAILVGVLTGRVLGGIMLDRIWPYWVPVFVLLAAALSAYAVTTAAGTLLVPVLFLVVFALGLAQGAEADFPAFFLLREFGPAKFAVVSGFAFLVAGVGAAIGGIGFSVLRDVTGNYTLAGSLGAAFYTTGLLLMAMAGIASKRAIRHGHPVFAGHTA